MQSEPSFSRAARDVLRQIRILLVLGGVLLLAGQALVVSSFVPLTRSQTASILAGPNWYYAFELNVLGSARVDLQFSEASGRLVDIRVLFTAIGAVLVLLDRTQKRRLS